MMPVSTPRNDMRPETMTTTNECDRCRERITDLDAGFSPGFLHQMEHADCGGTWRAVDVQTYRVVETIWYEYTATDEQDAVRQCEEDAERDQHAVSVTDRYAIEVDEEGNAK